MRRTAQGDETTRRVPRAGPGGEEVPGVRLEPRGPALTDFRSEAATAKAERMRTTQTPHTQRCGSRHGLALAV